jgi:hypothetical protein
VSIHVALVGNSVFADKIKMMSDCIVVSHNPLAFGNTHAQREEGHVTIEAQTRVMQPQTKGCQGLPTTPEGRRRKEESCPRAFRRSMCSLILNFWPPEL